MHRESERERVRKIKEKEVEMKMKEKKAQEKKRSACNFQHFSIGHIHNVHVPYCWLFSRF